MPDRLRHRRQRGFPTISTVDLDHGLGLVRAEARTLNRYRFRPAYIRTMSTIPNTVPSATIWTLWRLLFSSSSMTNLMASPRLLNSRCPGSFVGHCTNTTSLPIGAPSRSLAANGLSLESTRNFGWDIAA